MAPAILFASVSNLPKNGQVKNIFECCDLSMVWLDCPFHETEIWVLHKPDRYEISPKPSAHAIFERWESVYLDCFPRFVNLILIANLLHVANRFTD